MRTLLHSRAWLPEAQKPRFPNLSFPLCSFTAATTSVALRGCGELSDQPLFAMDPWEQRLIIDRVLKTAVITATLAQMDTEKAKSLSYAFILKF